MKKLFIIIITTILLQGCYNAKIVNSEKITVGQEYSQWKFYALWGLIPYNKNTSPCGDKQIVSVETRLSFLNQLINVPVGLFLASNNVKTSCST